MTSLISRTTRIKLSLFTAIAAGAMLTSSADAAVLYWDINGATAGATDDAGGLAPGTWDVGTTANWTTSSAGTSATTTWTNGHVDIAIFSAGTNATGAFTVDVVGTIEIGTNGTRSIRFDNGTVTLSGGTIALGTTTQREFEVLTGRTATITSNLTGSANLRIGQNSSYAGTLLLSGDNSGFTGDTTIHRGQVLVGSNTALGSGLVMINNDGKLGASADTTLGNNVRVTSGSTRGLGGGAADLTINGIVYSTAEHSTIGTFAGGMTTLAGGVAGRVHTDGNASLAFSGDGDITMASRIYTNVIGATMTGAIHGSDTGRYLTWGSTGTFDMGVDGNGDAILHMTTRRLVVDAGTVIVRGDVVNSKLVQQSTSWADTSADFIRDAHGLAVGDVVAFRQDAALPSGMNVSEAFHVVSVTANTFQLALTPGGSAIVANATGSGNIYHLTALGANANNPDVGGRVNSGTNSASNDSAFLLAGGDYTMSRGLNINASGTAADPTGSAQPTVTIGGIGAQDYTYAGTITIGSILGTSGNGNRTNVGRDLTVTADAGGTVNISGLIQRVSGTTDSGSFGTSGLIKVGDGTVILSHSAGNTYDGTTTINAGTLIVANTSGSGTGTGDVFVNSGGTLGGTGSIAGTVIINAGGLHAPGASPGSQTIGGGVWNDDGAFLVQINSVDLDGGTAGNDPGWTLLNVTGTLDINATSANPFLLQLLSLDLSNNAGLVGDFDPTADYELLIVQAGLINLSDPAGLMVDDSAFQNDAMGGIWGYELRENNTQLFLTFTADTGEPGTGVIPEPTAAALTLLGLAGLTLRRRRVLQA